ncbi:MAG TPA: hypothetical protein VGQ36_22520 [Thermoanaerobaculia bacterium]|jgi:hypothetical protein|nr:hypothetical protein [Thermoanaerobaculia bacterium]
MREQEMNAQVLTALLAEYDRLSDSFDKHATVGYTVLPLVLAGVGGYVVATGGRNEFIGIGVAILLALVIAGIGIGHSILNRIGLRLIEVELGIQSAIGGLKHEGPSFYTSYVGQGAPGLFVYFGAFVLIGAGGLVLGMIQWWSTLCSWRWNFWSSIMAVALPVLLNVGLGVNLWYVELTIKRERRRLLRTYSSSD